MTRTYIAFSLSMPGRNSWNGGWSGEGRPYVIVRSFAGTKAGQERATRILGEGSFSYSFGDGWVAGVKAEEVASAVEARKLQKRSAGFSGYDWMVDSIVNAGAISAGGGL